MRGVSLCGRGHELQKENRSGRAERGRDRGKDEQDTSVLKSLVRTRPERTLGEREPIGSGGLLKEICRMLRT